MIDWELLTYFIACLQGAKYLPAVILKLHGKKKALV